MRALRRAGDVLTGPSMRVLTIRGAGSALQFGFNVLLGQTIGAVGSGSYYLLTSYVRAFGVVGNLGLPMATLRDLSRLRALQADAASKALYRRNILWATIATFGLGSLLSLAAPWIAASVLGDATVTGIIRLAAAGAVLFTLRRIQAEALKAYGRQDIAVALEGAIQTLALALIVVASALAGRISTTLVLWGFLVVNAGLLGWGAAVWGGLMRSVRSRTATDGGRAELPDEVAGRLRRLLPFWGYGAVTVLATELPFFVLPRVADAGDIGLFGVAFRIVTLATTVLAALAAVFGPRFAAANARSDGRALRRDLLRSQAISLAVYGPIALVLFLVPRFVLGLFGSEFREAADLVFALTVGQLVDAATGLCGYVLTMAGREGQAFWLNAGALAVLLALSLVLGRSLGALGVAIAYAIALALRSCVGYGLAWKRAGQLRAAA